jgi:hypothetical protein
MSRVGSGMRTMSDSLIAFQPAIDEPSNMMPSANMSSSMGDVHGDVLHLAARIGEATSTNFTSLSLDGLQDICCCGHAYCFP